jgi:small subunit ribosomal protein S1
MGKARDVMAENGSSKTENIDTAFLDEQETVGHHRGGSFAGVEGDPQDSNEFMELFEESLKGMREGELVEGEVVQIDGDFALVDIGYKSEGRIHINEFRNPQGRITVKVGDKVDVVLVHKENTEGGVILSREKAHRVKIWDEIEDVFKQQITIRGRIMSQVKGGLSVDIGVEAFLPGSQADLRPVKDLRTLLGTQHDFMVSPGGPGKRTKGPKGKDA